MTVAELIAFLQTQPQELAVVYRYCSDYSLLEAKEITIGNLSPIRGDGYVERERPDRRHRPYLIFPGN